MKEVVAGQEEKVFVEQLTLLFVDKAVEPQLFEERLSPMLSRHCTLLSTSPACHRTINHSLLTALPSSK